MPVNTPKALFRGNATTTTGTTLYTVPASTTAIVTSLVISNNSASTQTATIAFDSIPVVTAVSQIIVAPVKTNYRLTVQLVGFVGGSSTALG